MTTVFGELVGMKKWPFKGWNGDLQKGGHGLNHLVDVLQSYKVGTLPVINGVTTYIEVL